MSGRGRHGSSSASAAKAYRVPWHAMGALVEAMDLVAPRGQRWPAKR